MENILKKFLKDYELHTQERLKLGFGIPPKPLDVKQTKIIIDLIKSKVGNINERNFIKDLLIYRVPPGVDDAAYIKASFLSDLALGKFQNDLFSQLEAIEILGTMLGGYNVKTLIKCLSLKEEKYALKAQEVLQNIILIFDLFHDICDLAKNNNIYAEQLLNSWANADWFLRFPNLENSIDLRAFVVRGEVNTDDLSPAKEAWSRPDIPLHANSMLYYEREDLKDGLKTLYDLKNNSKEKLVFIGDVVGTGSSRKSATNSLLWHIGNEFKYLPNKKYGGFCFANKIAPIFFNTLEDCGVLALEFDVSKINMGDRLNINIKDKKVYNLTSNQEYNFDFKLPTLLDEVRARGRINLIIGRNITNKARTFLGMPNEDIFNKPVVFHKKDGFTLAQKMVGRACGVEGITPGSYCEPKITTVGSQDTTGPMTRDELKDLACLGFNADLVLQSFCHTAAYPRPVDIDTQHTLPEFIINRGGISLKSGDGIIHSWLNRMLLPDTVGTGADSHTRFPIGISFPAGSGMVAFAAATGSMPLDMPESVLVRFKNDKKDYITLRDLVHAIPYYAAKQNLLTVEKKNKINVFNGRILEIEGLPNLKVEQAFEISDASAERSAGGCSILLDRAPIEEYLLSNITLLKWLIDNGYQDKRTIKRRIASMEKWLKEGKLLQPDKSAQYHSIVEIDLNEIDEPLLCCPNDPDDVKLLSQVQDFPIDEVFIGSCMTNIGHFRAAAELLQGSNSLPVNLWIVPPTAMDEFQLKQEGYYNVFGKVGARTEIPGCSLCMGNQARTKPNARVVSTSTRNFPNRMGDNAKVFLASAEVCALAAKLGRLPSVAEYKLAMNSISKKSSEIYKYLNFHQVDFYKLKVDKSINVQQSIELNI